MTPPRQGGNKVLEHGSQTSLHLDAVAAVLPNLSCAQLHKVFPVRCAINETKLAGAVLFLSFAQKASANVAQEMMNLIDRQHGRRRIVYGWRQSFAGNVHDNPKCKHRILLEGALMAHRDRIAQSA